MEEFSVTELGDFRRYLRSGEEGKIEGLVSNNLATSSDRDYNPETDFSGMCSDRVLSIVVHDSIVDLFQENREGDKDYFFNMLSEGINEKVSGADGHDGGIVLGEVYGCDVGDVAETAAEYYADNFEEASWVETERVMGNNGLYGRADIVRETDDLLEIRDIKTRYKGINGSIDQEKFKAASYGLISREDFDVDRVVLEFPLQEKEVEVDTDNWFGEIVDYSQRFEELLEDTRRNQVDVIVDRLDIVPKNSKEIVEDFDLPYNLNKRLAREAMDERA